MTGWLFCLRCLKKFIYIEFAIPAAGSRRRTWRRWLRRRDFCNERVSWAHWACLQFKWCSNKDHVQCILYTSHTNDLFRSPGWMDLRIGDPGTQLAQKWEQARSPTHIWHFWRSVPSFIESFKWQMLIAGDFFNEPSRFMLLMLFSCPASITSIWKAIDPFALLRLIYLSSDLVRS